MCECCDLLLIDTLEPARNEWQDLFSRTTFTMDSVSGFVADYEKFSRIVEYAYDYRF